jgi:sulfonate transport system ATP-binding protein
MITLERIRKSFGNGPAVLDAVDLELPDGSATAIVGSTGSGKSTLLRLMAGLSRPDIGIVRDGDHIVESPRGDFGVMFQEPRLMPWLTVEENVLFGLGHLPYRERKALAADALRQVGMAAHARLLPKHLSGGMAQRTAFARAIVARPRVLFLDEPFSALDVLTRSRLQEYVAAWRSREKATLILVTHDVEEAVFFGQRVVVLDGPPGRIRRRFAIDLPEPRDRNAAPFLEWKRRILAELATSLLEAAEA